MRKNTTSKPVPKQGMPPVSVVSTSVYSGPLPPSVEMEKYEAICPGAADRILRMAEKQSDHRQSIEAATIETMNRRSILGVIFAFIITIAAFILAGVCFYFGHAKAGVGIFGVTLATIVGTFIYGTNSDKREREAKHEKAQQVRKPSTT